MAKKTNPDQAIAVAVSADAGNTSAPARRVSSQPFRKRAGAPLRHQIKEDLFYNLRSGSWPPGSELPSEPSLCAHFDVSRATLHRALADLFTEGYLERHSGRGTFVCHPKLKSGVTSAYSRLSLIEPAVADDHAAKHFGVPLHAPVFRIERTTYAADGQVADFRNAILRGDIYRYRVELR